MTDPFYRTAASTGHDIARARRILHGLYGNHVGLDVELASCQWYRPLRQTPPVPLLTKERWTQGSVRARESSATTVARYHEDAGSFSVIEASNSERW